MVLLKIFLLKIIGDYLFQYNLKDALTKQNPKNLAQEFYDSDNKNVRRCSKCECNTTTLNKV